MRENTYIIDEEAHEHQDMYESNDDCDLSKALSFDTIYEGTLDDDFGNFDLQAAKDYLRHYANKLTSRRERDKKNQAQNQPKRMPGDNVRLEHLYELGKAKVILERNLHTHIQPPSLKLDCVTPSAGEVINRLYEKSRTMQRNGRHRREEIDRLRGLSNLIPHDKSSTSKKKTVHSLHSLRSPESLAQPEITVHRLYGRSSSMQIIGRGRRECIENKAFSQPALFKLPQTRIEIYDSCNERTYLRESLTPPQAVMNRLYGRSATACKVGRERREEIKTRAQSQPRMLVNTTTTPPSSFTDKLMNTMKSRESPSPRAVMARLYGRSSIAQKNGRERRDEIEVRSQSDPRMLCHFKTSASPNPARMKDVNKDPHKDTRDTSESFSSQMLIERLYGQSYRSRAVGRERREEIDKVRAVSNARSPIRVKGPTPTSHDNIRLKSSLLISSDIHDSPSPEEIAKRLYDRSMHTQQAGKDRREKVYQMRCTSLPRLNLHVSSSPSPAKVDNFKFSPSHLTSLEDTYRRLYGRSLHNQEVGKERRSEIDRIREISKSRLRVKLRDSSPAPHHKIIQVSQ